MSLTCNCSDMKDIHQKEMKKKNIGIGKAFFGIKYNCLVHGDMTYYPLITNKN